MRIIEYSIQGFMIILVAVFVLLPFSQIFYGSILTGAPGRPGIFTYENYQALFEPENLEALKNSFMVGLGAAFTSVFIGLISAWLTCRTDMPSRRIFEILLLVPYFIPPMVSSLAWTWIAGPTGLANRFVQSIFHLQNPLFNIYSLVGIAWVEGLFYVPIAYVIISGALRNMDPSLEESSKLCGASVSQTTLRITLPMALPSITAAAILIFVISSGDFSAAAVLGLRERIFTLSTKIFMLLDHYPPNFGLATALSVVLVAVTASLLLIQRRMLGNSAKFVTVKGKAFKPRVISLGKKAKYMGFLFCCMYLFLAVFLPTGLMVLVSSLRFITFTPSQFVFTLRNYEMIFQSPLTMRAIRNSLILGTIGASLSVGLCFFIAYILARSKSTLARVLDFVSSIPISLPAITIAVGLLWAWIRFPMLPVYGTPLILLVSYITIYLAYGVKSMTSVILTIDKELEESSRILGESWFSTLRRIVFPLVKTGAFGAWILLFIVFFREIASSILLYTSGSEVISVVLYDTWHAGFHTEVAALCTVMLTIILAILAIVQKFGMQIKLTT